MATATPIAGTTTPPVENFAALFEESLGRQEMRPGELITAVPPSRKVHPNSHSPQSTGAMWSSRRSDKLSWLRVRGSSHRWKG